MRTTLKRGVGRAASANGNGTAVFPPGTVSAVTRYRQPPPPGRTGLGLLRRILVGTFLALSSFVIAVAGGSYLYFHQSVASVRAHTPDVVRAARSLDIPVAHHAAIALVIGYDHRAGVESNRPSLSDTLMLIRADPETKTISLLSFPRDLDVPIYCGSSASDSVGHVVTTDRINSAYSRCGSKGTVLTIKHLTSLPDQLPDHGQLPRLQGSRRQAARRLDGRRPPLLQQEHRVGLRQLREHQPAAGLPAARRPAGARLRPLPPHRLRPLPARPPAGVRARVQGSGRAQLLVHRAAEPGQHDHAQHRGR